MLSWPHLGFSLDASVGVHEGNREELRRLLCYIYRHPFRLEGIAYDEECGKLVYQARRAHGLKGTDMQEFATIEVCLRRAAQLHGKRKSMLQQEGVLDPL